MASKRKFRHEDVSEAPKGWKVRTVAHASGHKVRIAFPPGRRRKGAGQLVSVLHPLDGKNPCGNPCGFRNAGVGSRVSGVGKKIKAKLAAVKEKVKAFFGGAGKPSLPEASANPKPKKNEFVKDSAGKPWFIDVTAPTLGKRYMAEAYPVRGKKIKTVGHPVIAYGTSESEAYDALLGKIDKNPRKRKSKGKGQKAKGKRRKAEVGSRKSGRKNAKARSRHAKRNLDEIDQAARLHAKFVGAPPKEVVQISEPTKVRDDYAHLGWMEQMVFHPPFDRKSLDLEKISSEYSSAMDAGRDEVRAWREIADRRGCELLVFDVKGDEIRLAASPDGKQLYFLGGRQGGFAQHLPAFKADVDHDRVDLGELVSLTYSAKKKQAGDTAEHPYYHIFAEEGGTAPRAFYDQINKRIGLIGGNYHLKEAELGIVN